MARKKRKVFILSSENIKLLTVALHNLSASNEQIEEIISSKSVLSKIFRSFLANTDYVGFKFINLGVLNIEFSRLLPNKSICLRSDQVNEVAKFKQPVPTSTPMLLLWHPCLVRCEAYQVFYLSFLSG